MAEAYCKYCNECSIKISNDDEYDSDVECECSICKRKYLYTYDFYTLEDEDGVYDEAPCPIVKEIKEK